jgi:large subunit ribosomal protein L18
MDHQKAKRRQQLRRRQRVRKNLSGTADRPRLSVFRSNKHIYAQLIDDLEGKTLASVSTGGKTPLVKYGGNKAAATAAGQKLAEAAKAKGITKATFDRGHYRYHGRVKALADGARSGGLQF